MVVLVFAATPAVAPGPAPFVGVIGVVVAGSSFFASAAVAPPSSHAKLTLETAS